MKNILFIVSLVLLSMQAFSQQNMFTLSGGYSFATIEDSDTRLTGWRINGNYEYNPLQGMFAHGFSFGYVSLSATEGTGSQSVDVKINSFPIYYAPKVLFGKDKFKGFIKGALGMQFSGLKREGFISLSDHDFGFYGGGGGGIMFDVTEQVFINAEYEIAWMSNSYYKDGWLNSAMGGIGIRF
jgi:hypothetical protein